MHLKKLIKVNIKDSYSMWYANQMVYADLSSKEDTDAYNKIVEDVEDNIGGYFINLDDKQIFNNTWLRYNEGNNFVYEIIQRTEKEVVLFTRSKQKRKNSFQNFI